MQTNIAAQAEALKSCPFCGSTKIDPEGWMSTDRRGPVCDDCSATAETIKIWNTRAATPEGMVMVPEGWAIRKDQLNELQLNSINKLFDLVRHGYKTIDTKVRKDAVETWFQTDWIMLLAQSGYCSRPCKICDDALAAAEAPQEVE